MKNIQTKNYGAFGGGICTRCSQPFERRVWMPNLIFGKLARCPHCGKWQVARRASADELKIGEDLIRQQKNSGEQAERSESADERLKRQIENSRFDE